MKEYEIRDSLGVPKKVVVSADTSPTNRRHPKMFRVKCTGRYKPTRGSEGAAGFDLYNNGGDIVLKPGSNPTMVNTLVSMEIPEGWVGLIYPRSSMGIKGLRLTNTTPIIDSDYRGEIKLSLSLDSFVNSSMTIKNGERYAQIVIVPHLTSEAVFVEDLDETVRGSGGFGSTGK